MGLNLDEDKLTIPTTILPQPKLLKLKAFLESAETERFRNSDNYFLDLNLGGNDKPAEVLRLLYKVLNTQSQVDIDRAAAFFHHLNAHPKATHSFKSFSLALYKNMDEIAQRRDEKRQGPYDQLFWRLRNQPGWGEKTAALFVKVIYQLHHFNDNKWRFWHDTPELEATDKLWLPVDAVIKFVFEQIYGKPNMSFSKINASVTETISYPSEIETWDHLWFWGFISQSSKDGKRVNQWNEAKYWMLPFTKKDKASIANAEEKAHEMIKLISL